MKKLLFFFVAFSIQISAERTEIFIPLLIVKRTRAQRTEELFRRLLAEFEHQRATMEIQMNQMHAEIRAMAISFSASFPERINFPGVISPAAPPLRNIGNYSAPNSLSISAAPFKIFCTWLTVELLIATYKNISQKDSATFNIRSKVEVIGSQACLNMVTRPIQFAQWMHKFYHSNIKNVYKQHQQRLEEVFRVIPKKVGNAISSIF